MKKVVLCPLSGALVVAGTAGHVVIAKFDTEILDGEIKTATMNIVSDRDGFVWKGHKELAPKAGEILYLTQSSMHVALNLTELFMYKTLGNARYSSNNFFKILSFWTYFKLK